MFGSRDRLEKRLRERGARAPAEVLAAKASPLVKSSPTGLAGATRVTWTLRLRVRPEGGQPYEVQTKAEYGQFNQPEEGTFVSVLYDPDDPTTLIVDLSDAGYGEGRASTLQARMESAGIDQEMTERAVAAEREPYVDPEGYQARLTDRAKLMSDMSRARERDPDGLKALTDRRRSGEVGDEEFAAELSRLAGGG